MRYTGIPRHVRKEMVRKKKKNDDFQVRKLNKTYPAYTSGDEVVDYQFSLKPYKADRPKHNTRIIMSKLTKLNIEVVFSTSGPLTITYNNLTLPVIIGFSEGQITDLVSVCETKEQILAILNAVTK